MSKKSNSLFYIKNIVIFAQSNSDFGRTSKIEHEIHTGNSTAVRQAIVGSLPIISRRCRSFCILSSMKEYFNPLKVLGLHQLCSFGRKTIVSGFA